MSNVQDLFNSEESVELDAPENPFTTPSDGNSNEDIFAEDFSLTPEHTKALEENLSLPAGQYKWDKTEQGLSLTLRKRYIEGDTEKGDVSSNGRLVYNVSGVVDPVNGGKKGRFSFDISPDIRYKRNQEGNVIQPRSNDFSNDNWAKFSKLYFSKLDRLPLGTKDVLLCVQQGMYYMYISLSKNGGNFLGNLKSM